MTKTIDLVLAEGCDYCSSRLPTIVLYSQKSTHKARMCRACCIETLSHIENPPEYPAVIENRDADLDILKRAEERGKVD